MQPQDLRKQAPPAKVKGQSGSGRKIRLHGESEVLTRQLRMLAKLAVQNISIFLSFTL